MQLPHCSVLRKFLDFFEHMHTSLFGSIHDDLLLGFRFFGDLFAAWVWQRMSWLHLHEPEWLERRDILSLSPRVAQLVAAMYKQL